MPLPSVYHVKSVLIKFGFNASKISLHFSQQFTLKGVQFTSTFRLKKLFFCPEEPLCKKSKRIRFYSLYFKRYLTTLLIDMFVQHR